MLPTLRRSLGAAMLVAGAAFTAASCDSPLGPRTGQVSLYLTDAPGDVLAAVVTIEEIYLQGGDGEGGRLVLRDSAFTTDLLTLVDSTHALLEDVVIPAGSYGQLRFVISGAYLEVEGEGGASEIYASSPDYAGLPEGATVTGSLQMPSLAQSGLKVTLPGDAFVVGPDDVVRLVVDFDVAESFGKLAGGSGQWVMHPVLRGAAPPPPPLSKDPVQDPPPAPPVPAPAP